MHLGKKGRRKVGGLEGNTHTSGYIHYNPPPPPFPFRPLWHSMQAAPPPPFAPLSPSFPFVRSASLLFFSPPAAVAWRRQEKRRRRRWRVLLLLSQKIVNRHERRRRGKSAGGFFAPFPLSLSLCPLLPFLESGVSSQALRIKRGKWRVVVLLTTRRCVERSNNIRKVTAPIQYCTCESVKLCSKLPRPS